MKRVAINGFGRIGRAFFRLAFFSRDIDVVAVNDLSSVDNLAYLLRYDSAQGPSCFDVDVVEGDLVVNGEIVRFFSEKNPERLPWGELGVDVVVECTGVFRDYDGASGHLKAGAKRVVISAPSKDDRVKTIVVGVNDDELNSGFSVTSNASCTTNAVAPVINVLDEFIGIEKAMLNTVHGYTASQGLVDGPHAKDFRRGRAAGVNIVPTSTGAAIATSRVYPAIEDVFDGVAIRVPVITGSIIDLVAVMKRNTSVDEVNEVIIRANETDRWSSTLAVTDEPLVSSDIVGVQYASLVDLSMTQVVGGNMVRVMSWYDNEMGYVGSLLEHVRRVIV